MRNNETGEFELVVGNKQLLSGFFIVVLLFAVAFAMGYVVGQNTQRPAKLAAEGAPANSAVNTGADPRPQPASPVAPVPQSSTPPAPDASAGPSSDTATQPAIQPTTQPAQGSPPAAFDKLATAPATTGIVASSELPPGSFWQVLAVKPEVAEAIRQALKDKGFQVALTPGTNNLTRVLVGPFNDSPSFGRAKTALETAGFQPVRYKRD